MHGKKGRGASGATTTSEKETKELRDRGVKQGPRKNVRKKSRNAFMRWEAATAASGCFSSFRALRVCKNRGRLMGLNGGGAGEG